MNEANLTYEHIIKIKKIDETVVYDQIKIEWWFESDYLNINTEAIINYFELVSIFKNYSWKRGSGHQIEEWVKKSNIESVYRAAISEISLIIKRD